jgi:L-lysine 2,3-aminomutase
VLNQSVLLKSVNDDADSLETLSKTLFEVDGVLPYYLHQLDPVAGAAHFAGAGGPVLRDLLRPLCVGRLPGYLVPRLVTGDSGDDRSKQPMPPSDLPERTTANGRM